MVWYGVVGGVYYVWYCMMWLVSCGFVIWIIYCKLGNIIYFCMFHDEVGVVFMMILCGILWLVLLMWWLVLLMLWLVLLMLWLVS